MPRLENNVFVFQLSHVTRMVTFMFFSPFFFSENCIKISKTSNFIKKLGQNFITKNKNLVVETW